MSVSDKRKALVVGINDYSFAPLNGCENDAHHMEKLLATHEKGDPNFRVHKHLNLSTKKFREKIEQLLEGECSMALLYFSGHGMVTENRGYLVGVNATKHEIGISMDWLNGEINNSKIQEIVVILDCCHAGKMANELGSKIQASILRSGVTILGAAGSNETAKELMGQGVFTRILAQGLEGAAGDIAGHVTTSSLYSHAEVILSPYEQRPVFKSFVSQMTPLRYCKPRVKKRIIRELINAPFFDSKKRKIALSPDMIPQCKEEEGLSDFTMLSAFDKAGLLSCPDRQTLVETALRSETCELNDFGQFIWDRISKGLY